ncbi:ferredoxin--NADP reductase [Vibrio sp. FNV 38]|nr:ferredoxin--NADP reductase [Vibrio sp. FNV 38]
MNHPLNGFQSGTVVSRYDWNSNLFSLRVKTAPLNYLAGQFTKLALRDDNQEWLRRAYSIVNHPDEHQRSHEIEFLLVSDPTGQLSPRLHQLGIGDELMLGNAGAGFMTLDEVNPVANELWLLSTGTGIGPYLAFLDDENLWKRYDKIILVHAVRFGADLCYSTHIEQLVQTRSERLIYVPIVSREPYRGALSGRIPMLLKSGELESYAGVSLHPHKSFVFVCGNPQMVKETNQALLSKGLTKHLRRQAGQFTSENYW